MKLRLGFITSFMLAVWLSFAQSIAAEVETKCFSHQNQRFADVFENENVFLTPDEQDQLTEIVALLCNEEIGTQEFEKRLTEFVMRKSSVPVNLEDVQRSAKTLSTSPLALLLLMEVLSVSVNQGDRESKN